MADPSELDDLARRYLDLWQDQLADLATDEDLASSLAETLGLISTGAAAIAGMTQAAARANQGRNQHGGPGASDDRGTPAEGAATTVDTSGDTDADVDVLARRVADLEQRIATLEAASGSGGERSSGRSRRR